MIASTSGADLDTVLVEALEDTDVSQTLGRSAAKDRQQPLAAEDQRYRQQLVVEQAAVQQAAVLGRIFTYPALAAVVGLPPPSEGEAGTARSDNRGYSGHR